MIQLRRGYIVELAIRHRLPLMGEFRAMPAAGALMSYGPNQVDMWRRSAAYVPRLSADADVLRVLLSSVDGARTLDALAAIIQREFPLRFPAEHDALGFVSRHEELWRA